MAKKKNNNKVIIKETYRNITGSVFERKVGDNTFYSIVVQKFYKNDNGEWEYTNSFNEDESLIAATMLNNLFTKLQEYKNGEQE